MRISVDRFEGDFAVVETETGETVNMPRCLIPDAAEGDVISVTVDRDETEKAEKKNAELLHSLFKR